MARCAAVCRLTRPLKNCSARAATAGSANTGAVSVALGSSAMQLWPSGSTTMPWGPLQTSWGCSAVPMAVRVTASGMVSGGGASSGTMRPTGRPVCSSAASHARNQARSQVATQLGASARAWGWIAKCSWAGSSNRRSSSRPSSTARRRGALPSWKKPRSSVPLGNSTRCHDSWAAGTTTTTSASGVCGNKFNGASSWRLAVLPSSVHTVLHSAVAVGGVDGRVTISEDMQVF